MANNYFKTNEYKLKSFTEEEITQKYNEGFVFTRLGKGAMNQTRSLRINLSKFKPNSENKRILRKTEEIDFEFKNLPLENYSWEIHKMGKEFYEQKGTRTVQEAGGRSQRLSESRPETRNPKPETVMSASKIKAMFNDLDEENMNGVFQYRTRESESQRVRESERKSVYLKTPNTKHQTQIAYCLVYSNSEILHYAYPFYDLNCKNPNLGMGMMIRGILWAKEAGLKYIYLGSVTTPESTYKLQFKGLEWFDTEKLQWSDDLDSLKKILS